MPHSFVPKSQPRTQRHDRECCEIYQGQLADSRVFRDIEEWNERTSMACIYR